MSNDMEADPVEIQQYSAELGNVNVNAIGSAFPAGCGGAGLAECKNLRDAMTKARDQAQQFLGDVDRGFNAFKAIGITCANEYTATDAAGAQDIAKTMLASPQQTARLVDNERYEDHYANHDPSLGKVTVD